MDRWNEEHKLTFEFTLNCTITAVYLWSLDWRFTVVACSNSGKFSRVLKLAEFFVNCRRSVGCVRATHADRLHGTTLTGFSFIVFRCVYILLREARSGRVAMHPLYSGLRQTHSTPPLPFLAIRIFSSIESILDDDFHLLPFNCRLKSVKMCNRVSLFGLWFESIEASRAGRARQAVASDNDGLGGHMLPRAQQPGHQQLACNLPTNSCMFSLQSILICHRGHSSVGG